MHFWLHIYCLKTQKAWLVIHEGEWQTWLESKELNSALKKKVLQWLTCIDNNVKPGLIAQFLIEWIHPVGNNMTFLCMCKIKNQY